MTLTSAIPTTGSIHRSPRRMAQWFIGLSSSLLPYVDEIVVLLRPSSPVPFTDYPLPSAIRIEPRCITVEVDEGTPDQMCELACQLLFELAMALNNNHDRFRDRLAAIEDAPAPASTRSILAPIPQK